MLSTPWPTRSPCRSSQNRGRRSCGSRSERGCSSGTARLADALPGDALLEHATAEIGFVTARHQVMCGLEQLSIGQARLSGKPPKLLGDVNAHFRRGLPGRRQNIALGTISFKRTRHGAPLLPTAALTAVQRRYPGRARSPRRPCRPPEAKPCRGGHSAG